MRNFPSLDLLGVTTFRRRVFRYSPEILVPLDRKQILLAAVALFACRDSIATGGFPPAYERNDMIHRQLRGGQLLVAIIADSPGDPALPPLRLSKLTRLLFLLPELLGRYRDNERQFLPGLHRGFNPPFHRVGFLRRRLFLSSLDGYIEGVRAAFYEQQQGLALFHLICRLLPVANVLNLLPVHFLYYIAGAQPGFGGRAPAVISVIITPPSFSSTPNFWASSGLRF